MSTEQIRVLIAYGKYRELVKLFDQNKVSSKLFRSCQTLLHTAVEYQQCQIIKLLLSNGVMINAVDENGNTPLILATIVDNKNIVSLLIEHNVDTTMWNNQSMTALMEATKIGRYEIVKMLLGDSEIETTIKHSKQQTNINHVNIYGQTALTIAVESGHLPIVELLVKFGADMEIVDKNGRTPLNIAARGNNFGQYRWLNQQSRLNRQSWLNIIKILIKHGANVNCQDRDGITPLMYAIKWSLNDIIMCLIENGADVSLRDNKQNTALMYAVFYAYQDLDILKLLFSRIRDQTTTTLNVPSKWMSIINSPDIHGYTPLLWIAIYRCDESYLSALWLIEHGADVNYVSVNNETLLTSNFSVPKIRLFVLHGIDINRKFQPDMEGNQMESLLTYAKKRNEVDVIRVLIELGADYPESDARKFDRYQTNVSKFFRHYQPGQSVMTLTNSEIQHDDYYVVRRLINTNRLSRTEYDSLKEVFPDISTNVEVLKCIILHPMTLRYFAIKDIVFNKIHCDMPTHICSEVEYITNLFN